MNAITSAMDRGDKNCHLVGRQQHTNILLHDSVKGRNAAVHSINHKVLRHWPEYMNNFAATMVWIQNRDIWL